MTQLTQKTKSTSLTKLFHPRSVAIVGASTKSHKVGNTVLRNLVNSGFQGQLYPVNPKYNEIDDLPCFASIEAIDQEIDLAIVCTPANTVNSIVSQCGQSNVGGVVILTAGFQETGQDGCTRQQELLRVATEYPDLRIIGPNCVGVINTASKLNASFARGMPSEGRISFVSQSGALCTSVLDWALKEDIGFANFVSIGNMLDVGWGELIDYFADDPQTDAIVLYIESVNDAERFVEATKRFTTRKPIIAYKAGRFGLSAAAAASHTGALAGEDAVYDTVFRRIGIDRVFSIEEMFDSAEMFARVLKPNDISRGIQNRLAIVSNAGGPAVMATDTLIELGGNAAELSDETLSRLDSALPANWSRQNPVDVIGDAPPERLAAATDIVLSDDGVDAVLVIVSPQAMTEPASCAEAVLEIAKRHNKPVLTSWMGGVSMVDAIEKLNTGGLPTFPAPERAVRSFLHLVEYRQTRERVRALPDIDVSADQGIAEVSGLVTEVDAKLLLADYEIEVVPTELANSEEQAVEIARKFGFPVVAKIASPEITHKSDIGGVVLNLENEQAVIEAYRSVILAAHQHRPQEIIMGVSIQPMIDVTGGYELIAGLKRDPVFGPVLMIGAGGINAEIIKDVVFELPPLDQNLATAMIQSLKTWPILDGFRGQPKLNTQAVAETLVKLAKLSTSHPEIKELDINPLLVTPEKAIALDARIVLNRHG